MPRRAIILVTWAAVLALGGAAAAQTRLAATQTNLDTNTLQPGIAPPAGDPGPSNLTPGGIVPLPGDPRAPVREQRGNPLWAIPLKVLTATRERPIFLPSRRAPAPAVAGPPPAQPVAAPPPAAPAPQRPRLTLIGAVVGDGGGIAVFLDEATRDVVRLRTGESRDGWILRSVRAREATFEKDRETMVIALPVPSDQQQKKPNTDSDNL